MSSRKRVFQIDLISRLICLAMLLETDCDTGSVKNRASVVLSSNILVSIEYDLDHFVYIKNNVTYT